MSIKSPDTFFTTDDYSVKMFSNAQTTSQFQSDPAKVQYHIEELERTYEKFKAFKAVLDSEGYLVDGVVKFNQDKAGARTVMYRVPDFVDLFLDFTEMNPGSYMPGNMPDLHMFQAHLQKPSIFGLSTSRYTRLFPEAFEGFADEAKEKFQVSVFKNDAIRYEKASGYFLAYMNRLGAVLRSHDVVDTRENRVKMWAATAFVLGGHSIVGRNTLATEGFNTAIEYLCGMLRLDVPLYYMFLFLASSTNVDFGKTNRMSFDVEDVAGFVGVPRNYLHHIVVDEEAKKATYGYKYRSRF